jgi:hypothetical protein
VYMCIHVYTCVHIHVYMCTFVYICVHVYQLFCKLLIELVCIGTLGMYVGINKGNKGVGCKRSEKYYFLVVVNTAIQIMGPDSNFKITSYYIYR